MGFALVQAQAGTPPGGVEELIGAGDAALDRDSLVVAGQALTWQTTFTSGSLTAVPLNETSAMVFSRVGGTGSGQWHERFARGLGHRMAGEITVASVTAGLLDEAAGMAEDSEMLGSAIDGLARLLTEVEEAQMMEVSAARIVADTLSTHAALMGALTDQQVSERRQGDFTIHTVRSTSAGLPRPALERARARVGLPWPTQVENGLGSDLGLARWCTAMQAHGHQMWSRLEDEGILVTDLWLRNHPVSQG
ncbi:hypothetical protein [Actinomadura sp. NPDC048394]|uniref:hypothetical protein n=1 Tax=Actinomadura sp. NPDC048394 TaxID=3158223 RepID=UPI0033F39126